jgi:acyl-lipid omega-6 desaturase (Delta-12 desaturase)
MTHYSSTAGSPPLTDHSLARSWRDLVRPYAQANVRQSLIQLTTTGTLFLATTAALLCGLQHEIWAAFVLTVPAAAFLVRLFIIQHDCGHGSFFKGRWANTVLGSALGVLTLTPYVFWRDRHALHHATSGNLDRRGVGDITTLTVREYRALPLWRQLMYRLYRHPLVMFGVGPAYVFVLRHRIPTGHPLREYRTWLSVLGTNVCLVAALAAVWQTVGFAPVLLGYGPVFLIAAAAGVWLFYVQHQFEDAHWERQAGWKFHVAALEGCSVYDLPRVLHWLTGHIGLHHIHHLSSRIPNYRLRDCYEQNPEFQRARRLSLRESLKSARLALWDEERRKLITFRQARTA